MLLEWWGSHSVCQAAAGTANAGMTLPTQGQQLSEQAEEMVNCVSENSSTETLSSMQGASLLTPSIN